MDTALSTSATQWHALGCRCRLVATDPHTLPIATRRAKAYLAALDQCASRFRADSEVSVLARLAASGPVTVPASRLFLELLAAAQRAAQLTDGLVDPLVGRAMEALGYDEDLVAVQRARRQTRDPQPLARDAWRTLVIDREDALVTVPRGALIDLGASAKAHAADRISAALARELTGGFLVELGGDIVVAGPAPAGGWQIGVETGDGGDPVSVRTTRQAIATSSTRTRTWATTDGPRHHIVDPRTGRAASVVWTDASVVAATALEANAASTAAIILGREAPDWLQHNGLPARLVAADGAITATVGWPA